MKRTHVKSIPLEAIMAQLGHTPQRVTGDTLWYRSPFREESDPSFNISRRKNLWFDFGAGKGGSAIDLIMAIEQVTDVRAACRRIDEVMATASLSKASSQTSPALPKLVISQATRITSPALLAYLRRRGIDQSLAHRHLQQIHYHLGEKLFYALGFQNDSGGFELRNPYFKGATSKDITTITGNRSRVFCFEGFMDFLTALSMFNGTLPGTAIILNSTGLVDKAIAQIRILAPTLVDLYRDNDAGGTSLLSTMQHHLTDLTIVDWANLYASHKDLNEWAVASERLANRVRSETLCSA